MIFLHKYPKFSIAIQPLSTTLSKMYHTFYLKLVHSLISGVILAKTIPPPQECKLPPGQDQQSALSGPCFMSYSLYKLSELQINTWMTKENGANNRDTLDYIMCILLVLCNFYSLYRVLQQIITINIKAIITPFFM